MGQREKFQADQVKHSYICHILLHSRNAYEVSIFLVNTSLSISLHNLIRWTGGIGYKFIDYIRMSPSLEQYHKYGGFTPDLES